MAKRLILFHTGSLQLRFIQCWSAVRIHSGLEVAQTRAAAVIPEANRTASAGRDRQRSRNLLVVAQVAMALVRLVSTLLMIRTFAVLMKSLLFGISPLDPFTYITVPLVLAASATFASYLPARRAAAVDPVEGLRAE
jgi:hypothetical protein